ncbi:MAG: hypothetical protein KatS3mg120_2673 [Erythrobacter sp.]|nr:MAG: hypothetical protein KatS3mg120_2673 [Erythrobacter sp.]
MVDLREALKKGLLADFIAEHEGEVGDADAFALTLQAMAGMSKEAPAASSPDGSGD